MFIFSYFLTYFSKKIGRLFDFLMIFMRKIKQSSKINFQFSGIFSQFYRQFKKIFSNLLYGFQKKRFVSNYFRQKETMNSSSKFLKFKYNVKIKYTCLHSKHFLIKHSIHALKLEVVNCKNQEENFEIQPHSTPYFGSIDWNPFTTFACLYLLAIMFMAYFRIANISFRHLLNVKNRPKV